MIVAGIGVVINTITALMFVRGQKSDLNIKGAFLHMEADAAVSLGVVLAGLAIRLTGQVWIDSVMSLLIVVVIVYGTWGLLRDRSTSPSMPSRSMSISTKSVGSWSRSRVSKKSTTSISGD